MGNSKPMLKWNRQAAIGGQNWTWSLLLEGKFSKIICLKLFLEILEIKPKVYF